MTYVQLRVVNIVLNTELHRETEMQTSVVLHTTWAQSLITVCVNIHMAKIHEFIVPADIAWSLMGHIYHDSRVGVYRVCFCSSSPVFSA